MFYKQVGWWFANGLLTIDLPRNWHFSWKGLCSSAIRVPLLAKASSEEVERSPEGSSKIPDAVCGSTGGSGASGKSEDGDVCGLFN